MTVLLIVLGALCLLGLLPVGVRLSYDETGGFVWLMLGFVRVKLYPRDTEKKKPTQTNKKTAQKQASEKSKGGSLTEFLPIARIVLDFLSDFRRRLWVQHLELKVILTEDDPCDLAVHYGQVWGVLGGLFPLLERYVRIKDRDLEIACDFNTADTRIVARADILITLGRFLSIALRHGIRGLRKYLHLSKKIKAVQ